MIMFRNVLGKEKNKWANIYYHAKEVERENTLSGM